MFLIRASLSEESLIYIKLELNLIFRKSAIVPIMSFK